MPPRQQLNISAILFKGSTWYYNHVSMEFQKGPDMLQDRLWHAANTLIDHGCSGTTRELPYVTGGGISGYYSYASTEFLLNGEWHEGKKNICTVFTHVAGRMP